MKYDTHFSEFQIGSIVKNKHGVFKKLRDSKGKLGGSAEVVSHSSLKAGQTVSVAHNQLFAAFPASRSP